MFVDLEKAFTCNYLILPSLPIYTDVCANLLCWIMFANIFRTLCVYIYLCIARPVRYYTADERHAGAKKLHRHTHTHTHTQLAATHTAASDGVWRKVREVCVLCDKVCVLRVDQLAFGKRGKKRCREYPPPPQIRLFIFLIAICESFGPTQGRWLYTRYTYSHICTIQYTYDRRKT